MSGIAKRLANELEATTRGLQHLISDLQHNLSELAQMVNGSDQDQQHQFSIWTSGTAARCGTSMASLLSRQRTLKEAIRLINDAQEQEEERL